MKLTDLSKQGDKLNENTYAFQLADEMKQVVTFAEKNRLGKAYSWIIDQWQEYKTPSQD